jgi:hypothetical protein
MDGVMPQATFKCLAARDHLMLPAQHFFEG